MPTLAEVKQYLGISFSDDDAELTRAIALADEWLKGAVGTYPTDSERAKQLALFVIEDVYDRKATSVKENATLERMKNDFMLQLRLEGRVVV